MGSDPQYAKYPDLSLAQDIFTLSNPYASDASKNASLKKLQDAISDKKMAPLYRHLAHPTEGISNTSGQGSAQATSPVQSKRSTNAASKLISATGAANSHDFPWDEELYERLKKENEAELETFKKEEEEAAEKAGETEIQAAKGKRAEFWARVGDKVRIGIEVRLSTKLTARSNRTKHSHLMRLSSRKRAYWVRRSTLYWQLYGLAYSLEIEYW